VRGKIRWEPTPELSATLAADYADAKDEGPWAVQAITGTGPTIGEGVAAARGITIPDIRNQRPVYAGEGKPLIHGEGWGQSLTLQWDAEAFSVKSITAHRNDESSGFLDLDGTPLPLFYFKTFLKSNVWQQELTVASKGDGPFTWLGGAYYLRLRDGYQELDQNVGISFPYTPAKLAALPAGSAHVDQYSYVTIKSTGVFGEVSYAFTPRDKLTLGARYTDEKQSLDPRSNSVTIIPNGAGGLRVLPANSYSALCAATPTCKGLSTPFQRWTYRGVYTHQFDDDVMAYASYNRGFKSGVYNISTISAANLTATRPETVNAFEAGVKSQWMDRRLTLNGAVYYNDYKDLQVPVTTPGNNTQVSVNAARAKIAGVELEGRLQATEHLTLQAGGSIFLKAKYDSFPNCSVYTANPAGGNITTSADCSGRRLPGTPNSVNLRADYEVPLASGATVNFNGLFAHQSSFNYAPYANAATKAPEQKAIETINLSATWRAADKHLYASVWGRDLADQSRVFRGLFTTGFGYESTFTRGATYGVTVGFDY
ncbi:MAG TPA: TonB-dependent receptor, partial [Phenylobacterium sp.]